ncbi:1-acyl-sn-glycerol-3-phosphate acyltransferase [Guyparkeria halopsychrophila]|uniref:lysophospholipid acyltransferase family protein n=1 Tax=Guyparkeria halopsychrophila TaxID=3139421 RepID=UPI0037C58738
MKQSMILAGLRTVCLYVLGTLSLILNIPVLIVSLMRPLDRRYYRLFTFGRSMLWLARHVTGIRYEVQGLEHLPKEGGSVVLAKHQSTWETMYLPTVLRLAAFVLKRELLRIPIFGQGLQGIGAIAIDRAAGRQALEQVMEKGAAALAQGRDVVIFPEGTRTRPGARPHYRIGGAKLAVHARATVIPVAIDSGCLWPKQGFLMRPGTIHVVFGPPIETEGRTASEVNAIAQDWIETKQEELYQRYGCPTRLPDTAR